MEKAYFCSYINTFLLMDFSRQAQKFPLLWVAVSLLSGMMAGGFFRCVITDDAWLVAIGIAVVGLLLSRRRLQGVFILLTVCLSGAYMMSHTEPHAIRQLPSSERTYQAVIMSEPVAHGKVIQMDLLVVGEGKPLKVKASLLRDTIEHRYRSLHIGDGMEVFSLLEPLQVVPYGRFDYPRWLTTHGYHAHTFIYYRNWRKAAVSLHSLSWVDKLRLSMLSFRQQLINRYQATVLQEQDAGIVVVMTLGDKSLIPKGLKDMYSMVGASHILALSGLHLTILYFVLNLITFYRRRQWLIQTGLLLGIWTYVLLAGLPVSLVRSALMLTVYSLAGLAGRQSISLNTLSLAAIVILIVHPFALYDTGFQLSFLSVLALILVYPVLARWMLTPYIRRHILLKPIGELAVVALTAQIGTAPLVAYYFHRFSCCFLLSNYVVIPCAFLILTGGVLFFLTTPIPFLQGWVVKALSAVIGVQNDMLSWLSVRSWASIEGIHLSVTQVFLLYVAIAILYVALRLVQRMRPVPEG